MRPGLMKFLPFLSAYPDLVGNSELFLCLCAELETQATKRCLEMQLSLFCLASVSITVIEIAKK